LRPCRPICFKTFLGQKSLLLWIGQGAGFDQPPGFQAVEVEGDGGFNGLASIGVAGLANQSVDAPEHLGIQSHGHLGLRHRPNPKVG
jgi:hypothetical protein